MVRTRKLTVLLCLLFPLAVSVVIMAQLGILASAWDLMPRESGYTYALDPALGVNGIDGAHDAFSAWSSANAGMSFKEVAWDDAEIRVGKMSATYASGRIVKGCACLGLWPGCPAIDNVVPGRGCFVPDGATIGVSSVVCAINGTLGVHTRAEMRYLVAHEIGHNLGLNHNTDNQSHLMYGPDRVLPYSDRGYNIPDIADRGWTPVTVSGRDAPGACG